MFFDYIVPGSCAFWVTVIVLLIAFGFHASGHRTLPKDACLWLLCLALAALFVATRTTAGELRPNIYPVAIVGETAPDSGGQTYETFRLSVNTIEGIFGPTVNNNGDVAFAASYSSGASTPDAYFASDNGLVHLVARGGQQAADLPEGIVYTPFTSNHSLVVTDRQSYFLADVEGGGVLDSEDRGIWGNVQGTSSLLVREGFTTTDGLTVNPMSNLFGVSTNGDYVTIHGNLSGPGVDPLYDNSVQVLDVASSSIREVVREGNAAPDMPTDVTFGPFGFIDTSMNNQGETTFVSFVEGPGIASNADSGIWVERNGQLTLIARENAYPPGTPPMSTFSIFSGSSSTPFSDPHINDVGDVLFRSSVHIGGTTSVENGLWLDDNAGLQLVAFPGEPIPGEPEKSIADVRDYVAVMNNNSDIAFRTDILDTGTNTGPTGVMLDQNGTLSLVAVQGEQAPGTESGVVFENFDDYRLYLNDVGQVAFRGILDQAVPGVDESNNVGIWATDQENQLHLIVREGDVLEVATGDFRTVETLSVVGGGSQNQQNHGTAFNDRGQLTFVASFTDGTEGVFVTAPYSVPEPCSLALLCVSAISSLTFHRRRTRRWFA